MALIHHWPLTDGSGTIVVDVVGGNNGTIVNAVPNTTWISDSPLGGALRLNGLIGPETVSPYVVSASNVTLYKDWAVAAKFRTINGSGAGVIGCAAINYYSALIDCIFVGGNGRTYGGVYTGKFTELWGEHYVNDGQWHTALLQHTGVGATYQLWVDGVLVYELPEGTVSSRTAKIRIGGTSMYPLFDGSFRERRAFDGDICDARVYDAALSESEIVALAGVPPTPIPTPWYVPQGALAGKGRVNFVNVIIKTFWIGAGVRIRYPGGYDIPYPNLALYPIDPILRYCTVRNQSTETDPSKGIYAVLLWGDLASEVNNEGWHRCPNFIIADNVAYPLLDNNLFVSAAFYKNRQVPEDHILSESKGQSFSTWGVSQYPVGFAPVPTFNVVNVSPGVNTLNDAVSAAKHGDNLVLAPGTYYIDRNQGFLTIDKAIRIYGATENPNDVVLTWSDESFANIQERKVAFYPYYMINVPENVRAPGLFHLTVKQTTTPSGSPIPDAYYEAPIVIIKTDYLEDHNIWNPPQLYSAIMFSCNT